MAIEYAYLAKKTHTLLSELEAKSGYLQDLLINCDENIQFGVYFPTQTPVGSPLFECEDTSSRVIRSCQTLRGQDLDTSSTLKWLDDLEDLSGSLFNVGLRKEPLRLRESVCQLWTSLASRASSKAILSRLAISLFNVAACYHRVEQDADALSHIDKALQACHDHGESALPLLAGCYSHRSHYLRFCGRDEEALQSANESVVISRKLANMDLRQYGSVYVYSLIVQGEVLSRLSRNDEALLCLREAMAWLSKMSPKYKQVYPKEYGWIYWTMARAYHGLRDDKRMREYGRNAVSVYHTLVRDRPLFYSYSLSYSLDYTTWIDADSALPVLEESLSVCLTVDVNYTAPKLADILDRRAATLTSKGRYEEAMESYDQAIDVRRHLLENDEIDDVMHFKSLLETFRHRAYCLFSLCRHRDAFRSLSAAHDILVSRLKGEIPSDVANAIAEELYEHQKLLLNTAESNGTALCDSSKDYKKALSILREVDPNTKAEQL